MNGKQLVTSTVSTIIKVVVLVVVIMVVYRGATIAYNFGYRVFTEEAVSTEPGITYLVTITEETTPRQLASSLEEYGLIDDANLFLVQYMVSDYRDALVPGSYELSTAMTADEMMEIMSQEDTSDDEADGTSTTTQESETQSETEATVTEEAGE